MKQVGVPLSFRLFRFESEVTNWEARVGLVAELWAAECGLT